MNIARRLYSGVAVILCLVALLLAFTLCLPVWIRRHLCWRKLLRASFLVVAIAMVITSKLANSLPVTREDSFNIASQ